MSTTWNLAATAATRGVAAREIGALLRNRRWLAAGAGLAVLAGAALEVAPALLIQRVVDDNLTAGRTEGLLGLALLYLLASGGIQALSLVTNTLTAVAAQGALHELRVRLMAHLQRLPMPYFDQTPLGELISRCTADVDTVDTLFSSGVASLLADVVRLAAISVALAALSPRLALLAAVIVPPVWWVTRRFQAGARAAERASRRAVGGLNTSLEETLSGLEVIRAFGREAVFVQRFRSALREVLGAYNRATIYTSLYTPLMAIVSAAAAAVLLWMGALSAHAAWGVSLGTLTAFVLLFRRFFTPIVNLGEEWQTVQSALSGAERILQVLALPAEESAGKDEGMPDRDMPDGLALREVTFGYVNGRPVLHGVSLRVRAGEQVALVGRTGAGKTSVLHLLAGLYAPWSGSVRVAGRDPRRLPGAERGRRVGVVPQTVQLFSGTVWDNLTLGETAISRAEVEQAAAITGAATFVRALPAGYDTVLGGGTAGVQLSAGQQQLLALTRALVLDPPMLLLDEATSLVDGDTEAAFRSALRADGKRAVLVIAHRLATARAADRVIVMDSGRIVEAGSPEALIRQGGRFAALLELEAAGWDWRGGSSGEAA